jgi:hypothetical protein
MSSLVRALRENPASVSWGGGSAGGTDHILAGLIVAAADVDPRRTIYIAFSGGGEAVTALLGGQVTAGISGYSECAPLTLGPMAEQPLRRALAIAEGSPAVLLTRPVSATLLAAAVLLWCAPLIARIWRRPAAPSEE